MKCLYIAEKPSVAREFANALKLNTKKKDGYLEADSAIITWCVGHLVTMSYPEVYDPALKKWDLNTLPFLPKEFKYEVIPGVSKQFEIVKSLLIREDVDMIYVCTDSGREGEYIYRLVDMMANVQGKHKKRVWIDSQTEEEIKRGIEQAKDLSEYDNLSSAAYLRAKEDYLMGINFSRVLTLKYGNTVANYLKQGRGVVIAVGRVMTCVLGMVVRREREIRAFVKTPFYRVLADISYEGKSFEAEWRAVKGSRYFESRLLYKENGFKEEKDAKELIAQISAVQPMNSIVESCEKRKEKKNPPLLYNLAELQNECSRLFKISPDQTLKVVQELYEKKLVTYPRTDARVLTTAVSKEIAKNLNGLMNFEPLSQYATEALGFGTYKDIHKTRYVDDKQVTDHYAIIPTGQGLNTLRSVSPNSVKIYETIARRFLSVFYPAAEYQKINLVTNLEQERFFATFKVLSFEGYLKVGTNPYQRKREDSSVEEQKCDATLLESLRKLRKGSILPMDKLFIKAGETSPPKRYSSGSIILAMENAGQLIEDEELRAQIKGSGIGTSATRAEILKKLTNNGYIQINNKTQIITPVLLGELIYDVVDSSIKSLLNAELTASWEKGLSYVAEGSIGEEEYMEKLERFVAQRIAGVKQVNNQYQLRILFDQSAISYR